MATDKKISYINQDGYKNYIKNSDSITIPKKFKARKNATSTHLAYITKAEAKQLKKQNKGTPHKGPKGIPSYDDYDASAGGYGRATSGQQMSAMESRGGQTERHRADARSLGYTPQEVADIRGGAQEAAAMGQRRSGIGGLLGALGRGALSIFGGIPGKVMSGIMTAKDWAKRKGTGAWEGFQEFGARDEEGNPLYPTWESFVNRDKVQPIQPIETIDIREKFDRTGNNNLAVDNQVIEEQNFNPNFLALGAKDGGRIGLRTGGDPEGIEDDLSTFEFMQDQGIPFGEMASAVDPMDALNDMSLEVFGKPLDELSGEEYQRLIDMANDQAMGEQDQGIASLV